MSLLADGEDRSIEASPARRLRAIDEQAHGLAAAAEDAPVVPLYALPDGFAWVPIVLMAPALLPPLKDAAHLQMEDAEYLNRKGLTSHKPALPLFDDRDVERALKLFVPVSLGKTHIAAVRPPSEED